MKKGALLCVVAMFAAAVSAKADEGMWMVSPGQNIADAVVSLDFGCSGSVISESGLIITNHHCAYSDVYALSTEEHNYLEDGFWAMSRSEEVNIKGKHVQFLREMIDVTDEVNELIRTETEAGRVIGSRKLGWVMEKRYKEKTGLEASLSSMWAGSKYYMALYEEYLDVRLVAAPPVSISAFGGDIDNWEWPQHKCDFALYRIYTAPDGSPAEYSPENIPLSPKKVLPFCLDGVKPGDETFVVGYPGTTDRYSSSAKVRYKQNVSLPVITSIRGAQMDIMKRWMASDPSVRLKYADHFFMLSNIQELQEGEASCYRRFGVIAEKEAMEKEFAAWIDGDASRKARWGSLLGDLARTYEAVAEPGRNTLVYRETLVRGTSIALTVQRLSSNTRDCRTRLAGDYAALDLRVERDLFRYSIEAYFKGVDEELWGPYQKKVHTECTGADGKCDFDRMAEILWDNSVLSDYDRAVAFAADPSSSCSDDPLFLFFTDRKITDFNSHIRDAEGDHTMLDLNHEYTHALYTMRLEQGIEQYPDANSTMRLSRGTVSEGLEPRDGVRMGWQSTTTGILEKYDPEDMDYTLKGDWKELLEGAGEPVPVNFITDNDITGGNSGSPVVNADGALVGLAFDGNKESLASDSSFTEDYNKCVCVDIRYVVWTLRNYSGMDYILEELGLQ